MALDRWTFSGRTPGSATGDPVSRPPWLRDAVEGVELRPGRRAGASTRRGCRKGRAGSRVQPFLNGEQTVYLTLARHGETTWSRTGQHTGRTDLPLTERGQAQARALAVRLEGSEFDAMLSSPSQRARDTAAATGREFATDERLVELDYGAYEGLTTVQIRGRRPAWDLWFDGCPDGETVDDVALRVDAVLQDLIESGARSALLVGHSHTFRVLAARYLGMEPQAGRLFRLDTATLSELGEYHARPVVVRWNTSDHLA